MKELFYLARNRFALDIDGTHGIRHWMRVRRNGLRLARLTGANVWVVNLFAILHDSCRQDEWEDFEHGPRAALWCDELWRTGQMVDVSRDELATLQYACSHHTSGQTVANVTVQTCWDADRLDIGRVGIEPSARFLCTQAARDMLPALLGKG